MGRPGPLGPTPLSPANRTGMSPFPGPEIPAESPRGGADPLERIALALERIALALERAPAVAAPPPPDPRTAALGELRRAIREADFPLVEELFSTFAGDHPEATELPRLTEDLEGARTQAIDDRRRRLDAARAANDA